MNNTINFPILFIDTFNYCRYCSFVSNIDVKILNRMGT